MKQQLLRGVNLGGWLVLEKWITPSLFADTDAVDEYTFMQTKDAARKLKQHRDSFITEDDFKWLKDHGLNAVRLPIGYWLLEPDGPYAEGIAYVDWTFAMAEKYDLQVLLDLHGAPDSQNGHDHSGREGEAHWFKNQVAQEKTLDLLNKLHSRYNNSPSYWGIELLNEPKADWHNKLLRQFYTQAAKALMGNARIVFHDGFRPRLFSGALKDKRAVMDMHLYHMASWVGRFVSATQFVRLTSWWWGRLLQRVTSEQPVIIGEWSLVLKGKKLRHMDDENTRSLMQQFGQKQLELFERYTIGWFYWTYKTEEKGLWNFRAQVEAGRISLLLNR